MRIRSSSSELKKRVDPGIALTAGAAAELVVDPPRLVPLRADDVQTAEVDDALARGGCRRRGRPCSSRA